MNKKILLIGVIILIICAYGIWDFSNEGLIMQQFYQNELEQIRTQLEERDEYIKIVNNISPVGKEDIESQFKYLLYSQDDGAPYIDTNQNFTIGIPKKILELENINLSDATLLVETKKNSEDEKKTSEYLKLPAKNNDSLYVKKGEKISDISDKRIPFYFKNLKEKETFLEEKDQSLSDAYFSLSHGIFTTKYFEKNLKDIKKIETDKNLIYTSKVNSTENPYAPYETLILKIYVNKDNKKIEKEILKKQESDQHYQIIYYKDASKKKIVSESIEYLELKELYEYYINLLKK